MQKKKKKKSYSKPIVVKIFVNNLRKQSQANRPEKYVPAENNCQINATTHKKIQHITETFASFINAELKALSSYQL